MKKTILILLCCAMILVMFSCDKTASTSLKELESDNKKAINTSQSTLDLNSKITPVVATTNAPISDSPQLDFYNKFQTAVNANVYDEWYEAALKTDSMPISQIYGKYCTYWKNEFDFTIEKAKVLFEDESTYLQWKQDLYAWLEITQKAYQNEMTLMDVAMNRFEIMSPYCNLIRQKVIDTKYFLYVLECNVIHNHPTAPIGLQWANDLSI